MNMFQRKTNQDLTDLLRLLCKTELQQTITSNTIFSSIKILFYGPKFKSFIKSEKIFRLRNSLRNNKFTDLIPGNILCSLMIFFVHFLYMFYLHISICITLIYILNTSSYSRKFYTVSKIYDIFVSNKLKFLFSLRLSGL